MIIELNIKNFAIMENVKINFSDGFNVLTGETGTGKSIVVEALNMVLGDRASSDYIRTGSDKAIIEGLFYIENRDDIDDIMNEFGIESDNNGYLLISREILSSGKSLSRVNGRTITLNMLNKITNKIVDIHSQHQHYSLLNPSNHIDLIDDLARKSIDELLTEIKGEYNNLTLKKKKLNSLDIDPIERDRNLDLYTYQMDELIEFDLDNFNENEITNEYNKLSNIKAIENSLYIIIKLLKNEDYEGKNVLDEITLIISELEKINNYDENILKYLERVKDIYYNLEDFSNEIKIYAENTNINEEEYIYLEEKIKTYESLKRKYGSNLNEIKEYRDDLIIKIEELNMNQENIDKLNLEISQIENSLMEKSIKLSDIRKKTADVFVKKILSELSELNMKDVRFKVQFSKKDNLSENGIDDIEFYISTNLGEELKPLSKIISGGELSRIMLAFKSIFADYDNIDTLILDEIDTGISGKTAQLVGEKIKGISRDHQIICVSHLPQIASFANTHFLIEKKTISNETQSFVRKLNDEDRILEISRLIGGSNITNTTISHAKEILENSRKYNLN